MKKTQKSLIALIAVPIMTLAVGGLSSCSGGSGPIDTYDLDVTVDTEGVSINIWTGFGKAVSDVLEPLLEDFSSLTKINVTHDSKGGYTNLQTAINLSATNLKMLPQIANGYPDHFAGYISSDIQLRLDGLMENDKNRATEQPGQYVNALGETITELAHFDYEDFYSDYTIENENLEFDKNGKGYVLGVPFNKSTEVMVYNKPLFDWTTSAAGKAKLTSWEIGEIFIPETWAQVKSVGLNLIKLLNHKDSDSNATVAGNYLASDGKVYAVDAYPAGVTKVFDGHEVTDMNMFRPFSYDSTENMFTTLLRQYGGSITEVDKTRTGKGYVNFNDDSNRHITIEALTMLQDLWDSKVIGIASVPWEDTSGYCSVQFKAGRSVMNIGSTAGLYAVVGSFDVGIAPVPYAVAARKFVLSQGTNLALFQVSESDPDREKKLVAAWKLLVFLSQAENATFTSQSGYFPTGADVAASKVYQDWLVDEMNVSDEDIAKKDSGKINNEVYNSNDLGWNKFTDPGFRGSSDIRVESGLIAGYLFNKEFSSIRAILDKVYAKLSDYKKA